MKLSIFPLTPDLELLLKYTSLLLNYEVTSIISYIEDREKLQKIAQETNILCTTAVEQGIACSDALVLMDNLFDLNTEKYRDCIECAQQLDKPIFYGSSLKGLFKTKTAEDFGVQSTKQEEFGVNEVRLYEFDSPIIAVFGMGENCGKFECQIQMKHYFEKLGFSALSISSNHFGKFFGMETLPDFLFDDSVSFHRKVIELNRFVYSLCKKYDPDVVILGVPSGIAPISVKDTNFFCELPLVASEALKIDAGIMTLFYQREVNDSYLQQISDYCMHRLGVPIDSYFMSQQMAMYDPSKYKMDYLFLTDKQMETCKPVVNSKKIVSTPFDRNNTIYEKVVESLKCNVDVI